MEAIQTSVHGAVLSSYCRQLGVTRLLVVCGRSAKSLHFWHELEALPQFAAVFSGFEPNPELSSVYDGVMCFRDHHCDGILAIGGGSALDVAKGIKVFTDRPDAVMSMQLTEPVYSVPMIAIPTTAGTGSEATHFSVLYKNGVKQSVAHGSMLPEIALLDADTLTTLPLYQKQCTMLDALSHALESYWSIHATQESRLYASQAIRLLVQHGEAYLLGTTGADEILMASHLAGKAINIARTTAAHAMSYKLTKLYGLPHGHSVMLCLPGVWAALNAAADRSLQTLLDELAALLGCSSAEAPDRLRQMMKVMKLESPILTDEAIDALTASVNVQRLNNAPVPFTARMVRSIYEHINSPTEE